MQITCMVAETRFFLLLLPIQTYMKINYLWKMNIDLNRQNKSGGYLVLRTTQSYTFLENILIISILYQTCFIVVHLFLILLHQRRP